MRTPSHHTAGRGVGRPPGDGAGRDTSDDVEGQVLAGVRVLLVEDDPASAKLAAFLLRGGGAEVDSVASAEEALVAIARRRPDLVVLDLVLPRMGGLLLAEMLKANPSTSAIVLVAVSSMNGGRTERLAKDAGCAGLIRKPIDIDTFTAILAGHLRGGT
jgi:CheY-like chemotaxis protein